MLFSEHLDKDLTPDAFISRLEADDVGNRFIQLTKCDDQGRNLVHELISAGRLDLLQCAIKQLDEDQLAGIFEVRDTYTGNTVHTLAVKRLSAFQLYQLLRLTSESDTMKLLKVQAEFGCTAIHLLAEVGATEKMKVFVDFYKRYRAKWVDLLRVVDDEYQTAVHYAAEMGNNAVIDLMLGHLSSKECASILKIKGNDDFGAENARSALHMAVEKGNLRCLTSMMRPVMEAHDRLNLLSLSDVYGETILHWAMEQKNKELLKTIMSFTAVRSVSELFRIQSNAGDTCIHKGASKQWIEGIEIILHEVPGETRKELLQMTNEKRLTAEDIARDSHAEKVVEKLQSMMRVTEDPHNESQVESDVAVVEDSVSRKQANDIIKDNKMNMASLRNQLRQKEKENKGLKEEIQRITLSQEPEKMGEAESDHAVRRMSDNVPDERRKMQELEKDKSDLSDKVEKQKEKIKSLRKEVSDKAAEMNEIRKVLTNEMHRDREGFNREKQELEKIIIRLETKVEMLEKQEANRRADETMKSRTYEMAALREENKKLKALLQERGDGSPPGIQRYTDLKSSTPDLPEALQTNDTMGSTPQIEKDLSTESSVGEKENIALAEITVESPKSESGSESDGSEELSIPPELEDRIDELCGRHNVEDYILLQNPSNLRKVVILGKNTEKITPAELKELIKTDDSSKRYSVTVSKRKDLLYSRQFMRVAHYLYDRNIRCELLVKAKSDSEENLFYILGCAHTMFPHQMNQELRRRNVDHRALRQEITRQDPPRNVHVHFGARRADQETGDPETLLNYSKSPLIGLRHHYVSDVQAARRRPSGVQLQPEIEAEELKPHHCMNDLLLLKFDHNLADDYQQHLAQHHPPNVGPLVRITNRNELKKVIQPPRRKYCIWVNRRLGFLCKHTSVDRQQRNGQGYHLLFQLDEQSPLQEGDSGSIVYLEKDGQYQPLGMFVAQLEEDVFDDGAVYYMAIILSLAFKDIEELYDNTVSEIDLL